jgi:hypothetical protein
MDVREDMQEFLDGADRESCGSYVGGAPVPSDEIFRQYRVLAMPELLTNETDGRLNAITKAVSNILGLPVCLCTLINGDRMWFKSKTAPFRMFDSAERTHSFSAWTLMPKVPKVLVVTDALEDVRFHDNKWVTGEYKMRFYAGAPLTTPDDVRLGALCVIDFAPHEFSVEECHILCNFAVLTMTKVMLDRFFCKTICVRKAGPVWTILYACSTFVELLQITDVVGADFWDYFRKSGAAVCCTAPGVTKHWFRMKECSATSEMLYDKHLPVPVMPYDLPSCGKYSDIYFVQLTS